VFVCRSVTSYRRREGLGDANASYVVKPQGRLIYERVPEKIILFQYCPQHCPFYENNYLLYEETIQTTHSILLVKKLQQEWFEKLTYRGFYRFKKLFDSAIF
jgi:hypothetical protein